MPNTLTRFVKNECSNFDNHYQTCIDDTPCKVLSSKPCGYFEHAVLGPPDYKFRLPNWDYQKLFAQYTEQTGKASVVVTQRLCECGKNLQPRQRLCDACAKIRAIAANRQRQKKHRLQNVST